MRLSVAAIAMAISSAALAEPVGLPSTAFVVKWAALPTGRFTPIDGVVTPVRIVKVRATSGAIDHRLVEEGFAAATDNAERRGIALNAMMSNEDQAERTSLQRVRDAEHAYSVADGGAAVHPGRDDAFVALASRVTDGTGRSVATNAGASDAALSAAYDKALSGSDDQQRKAIVASQHAWSAYRDAFMAFAATQNPGTASALRAELTERRTAELAAR